MFTKNQGPFPMCFFQAQRQVAQLSKKRNKQPVLEWHLIVVLNASQMTDLDTVNSFLCYLKSVSSADQCSILAVTTSASSLCSQVSSTLFYRCPPCDGAVPHHIQAVTPCCSQPAQRVCVCVLARALP